MDLRQKRAQISVFIIIGILVLLVAGLVLYARQAAIANPVTPAEQISLSSEMASAEVFVNQCLKKVADDAIGRYGFEDTYAEINIRDAIEKEVPECTGGFASFKEQGITITAGKPEAGVNIYPTSVSINLKYPLSIQDGQKKGSVSEFRYAYARVKSMQTSGGQVLRAASLMSTDKSEEFYFPAGIMITDYNGNPVDVVKLTEQDRSELAFPENVVSSRVFEITPSQFSEPVKVTLSYPENYPNPEELYVAWYDEKNGIWHGLPTTRDANRKTLTAEMEHATKVAGVKCSPGGEVNVESLQALVFEQKCGRTIGKAVAGGSEISGSCVGVGARIPTPGNGAVNLWKKTDNGLFLNYEPTWESKASVFSAILSVKINEEFPKGQLSSPCVIKKWGKQADIKNDDVQKCKANVPEAEKISLKAEYQVDPDSRCKTVCSENVKSSYGELYENLKITGGDGYEDGKECTCTRKGDDLQCNAPVLSPAPTPGYETGTAGGYGVLEFYIQPGGCVVDLDSKGTPAIAVFASDQDPIVNVGNIKRNYELVDNKVAGQGKVIAPKHYVINPKEDINQENFPSFLQKIDPTNPVGLALDGSDLKAGLNKIYFYALDIQSGGKPTGCAHLWVNAQIKGRGISLSGEDVKTSWKDCTVQQRINVLTNSWSSLSPEGQAELTALKEFKGGSEREETENGKKSLSDVQGYETNFLSKNTGILQGCGGESSKTDLVKELEKICRKQGTISGGICYNDNIVFQCSVGTLFSYKDCSLEKAGTVCNAKYRWDGLTFTGDLPKTSFCVEPNKVGCEARGTQKACFERGKPEMYWCENGIRKESKCAEGNCYFDASSQASCAEDFCINKNDKVFHCNGKDYYKCDGGGHKDPNIKGTCKDDEKCVEFADKIDSVCISTNPKCTEDRIKQSENGAYFCVDKGVSAEIYSCSTDGSLIKDVCKDPGTVCLKDGDLRSKVCGKSTAMDSFCEKKKDGFYCESPISGSLIFCQGGKYVETKTNYCTDKYGVNCKNDLRSNPDDSCKVEKQLPDKSKWDKYECMESGKSKVRYVSLDGKTTSEVSCPAAKDGSEQVCDIEDGPKGKVEELCKTKYDYFCVGRTSGKVISQNVVNCVDKGKSAAYYYCKSDPTGKSVVEGSCDEGKMCTIHQASTIQEACNYKSASGCTSEISWCVNNRQVRDGYSCVTNPQTQVLEKKDNGCQTRCCGNTNPSAGEGAGTKCDGECDSYCYFDESTSNSKGPGKAKGMSPWYNQYDFACNTQLNTAHKCIGGSQGWSSWVCPAGKYCNAEKKDCVDVCSNADLNKIAWTGKENLVKPWYYVGEKAEYSPGQSCFFINAQKDKGKYICTEIAKDKASWAIIPGCP